LLRLNEFPVVIVGRLQITGSSLWSFFFFFFFFLGSLMSVLKPDHCVLTVCSILLYIWYTSHLRLGLHKTMIYIFTTSIVKNMWYNLSDVNVTYNRLSRHSKLKNQATTVVCVGSPLYLPKLVVNFFPLNFDKQFWKIKIQMFSLITV